MGIYVGTLCVYRIDIGGSFQYRIKGFFSFSRKVVDFKPIYEIILNCIEITLQMIKKI